MTDWSRHNLPAIWDMLHTENACTGADRVLDWRNLAGAVREQHRRLKKASTDLAEAWPPGSNTSAQVFLQKMDALAQSMDQTLAYAENTRAGLQGVIDAIGRAQMTIRPLVGERAAVADDLVPRMIDKAEDEYDEKAQEAMRAADKAVAEHSAQIQAPRLYVLKPDYGDEKVDIDDDPENFDGSSSTGSSGHGGSGGNLLTATPRPVPVSTDLPSWMPDNNADGGGADGGIPGGGAPIGGLPGGGMPAVVTPPGAGPDLAGLAPTAPGLPGGSLPTGLSPSPVATGGSGGAPGMVIGGMAPSLGVGTPGALFGQAGRATAGGGRQPVSVRSAMPSGAVIGGPGSPGAGGRSLGGQMVPTQMGRPANGASEGELVTNGEPDQVWGVNEGVAPVIVPDTSAAKHDPGPGVIGRRR